MNFQNSCLEHPLLNFQGVRIPKEWILDIRTPAKLFVKGAPGLTIEQIHSTDTT